MERQVVTQMEQTASGLALVFMLPFLLVTSWQRKYAGLLASP